MSRGSTWSQIAERVIHDAWSGLQRAATLLEAPAAVSAEHRVLIEHGEYEVLLDDENEFHSFDLPPSVIRWGALGMFCVMGMWWVIRGTYSTAAASLSVSARV